MIVDTLRVFVTVAEQRHFSKAAELLNMSQPGVSQHIRNMENELGTKLMLRSPKQVKLTEEGTILYRKAKQILGLYEEAKQQIHLLHEVVTGSIQIGASFTIGEYILPRLLAKFAEQYPEVDLQLTIGNTEEIVAAIRANELDLALVEGIVSDHPDLIILPYMQDEMILVAAPKHPLSLLPTVNPADLADQNWIIREAGSGTRAFSDHFLQVNELQARRSYVFNSSQGVKEAVSAGLGIAVLSRLTVRKELDNGELREIAFNGPAMKRELSFIRNRQGSLTLAAEVFQQKVQEQRQTVENNLDAHSLH
ncbi:LysR family transcriptional regulator [Paenibacillus fonticola]|uniref:LysR family transcriptional regulator n=1 Tax=Paenibacillus fonticola TaxID=379896 RepID=UPI00036ABD45|nr:LysR family transcriptional regulator [Paenibacillus fonticola]